MPEQLPIQFEYWGNQTFADFYPADNQAVLEHLRKTARGEGERQVFLWGDSGHGKTHLLHACCEEAYNWRIASFYFAFTPDFNSPELFTDLETIELVCLDDIHFLCGNPELELALFNFFNRQRELGHRLITSANAPPQHLAFGLPDLQTRLNWGLPLNLKPLSQEDKFDLLQHKARQMGFELPSPAAQFLLTHYDRCLASLWTALDKLDLASLAAKRRLTIPFLKQTLSL